MLSRLLFFGAILLCTSIAHAQFPCIEPIVSLAPGFSAEFCDEDGNDTFIRFRSKPAALPTAFLIADENDIIVYIGYGSNINVAGLGNGLRVYSFTLIGGITAEVGDLLFETELASGCFELSENFIPLNNGIDIDGGELTGGPFSFCVGDGEADMIAPNAITLSGNSGESSAWIVTDEDGNILGLPPMPSVVDFDGAVTGTCLIYNISYFQDIDGLEMGGNINELDGCFDLSNSIAVNRIQPDGGVLEGGPFEFCARNMAPDFIMPGELTLSGNSGSNNAWIITDLDGEILGLPPSPEDVNFQNAGGGTCLVWHISYEDGLEGLMMGANANNLQGCFDLSNPVTVIRYFPEGGVLEGGNYEFCVDGEPDFVTGLNVINASGTNNAWIITNDMGTILDLPPSLEVVNFDEAGPGLCLIYNITFEDGLQGLTAGAQINELSGCFDLTNPIEVVRKEEGECDDLCNTNGGLLQGGPFEFCLTDDEDGFIPDGGITLIDAVGSNTAWVITDPNLNILGLPPSPEVVDFAAAGSGVCLVWHISYEDGLEGLEMGMNAADLEGCFNLSNPIDVVRRQPNGGLLTGGPFTFCVGDGEADQLEPGSISLTGNNGAFNVWVITDEAGNILDFPLMPSDVNFDDASAGNCLIWNLSFEGDIFNAEVGNNTEALMGCFSLSNPVTIIREQVEGGSITTEDGENSIDLIVNDGQADEIAFTATNVIGDNFALVVTDENNVVVGLPPGNTVNFEGTGAGICRVWGLAYSGTLTVQEGDNVAEVALSDGCFSVSDIFVAVNRTEELQPTIPQTVFQGMQVSLYPNPVVDQLRVNVTFRDNSETVELSILQLDGRILHTVHTANPQHDIDLSALPAGAYVLRVVDGNTVTTQRFVKQ